MGQPSLNEEDVKRLMEEQPEEVERLVKEINAMKQVGPTSCLLSTKI